ncbi:Golgi apparatus membrane protein tvp23 [Choanephora cucurbitarum]|uniref:Golgi apparatus membrane protein TVP23 n=1 Tax=Choanephora cucurbitarum TaxID=101091 RepID=A0A1C7N9Q1_9FUNG|nr:Golgi apparatus membrane protein tvp23 [Choanephora cucurbitarum]
MPQEDQLNLLQHSATISADQDLESGFASQPSNNNNRANLTTEANSSPGMIRDYFEQSSHPVAAFFFLAFRLGALFMYLLGSIFTDNFTLVFVITILLLAFDFWTVKNISGRLLVGLRWWNEIQPDGSNKWVFESANPSRINNPADTRLFWWTLYGTPALWGLFAFSCIITLKFSWLIIVGVALVLNMANVYGYTQCDKDAKKRWATGMATRSALGSLSSGATGLVGKAFTSGLGKVFGSR